MGQAASVHPMKPNRWADQILAACQKSVAGILEVGGLLIKAKADLPHGEFERMVEEQLPFSPPYARKLMAIAKDARLAKRSHVNVLPSSVGTLYAMTTLDDEQWERAEGEGAIRHDSQRKEITAFRNAGKAKAEPKPFPDVGVAEMQLMTTLEKFIQRWPANDMWTLSNIFKQLAKDVMQK